MPRQARAAEVERPTRSGPARAAATPHPTARATPAARPAPLHPTRAHLRDGLGRPRVCIAATSRVDSPHRVPAPPRPGTTVAVEDLPMPLYATLAALTLVVTFLAVPRPAEARRRARLFRAQQEWAEQLDRRG
jgi:hypothetical protein